MERLTERILKGAALKLSNPANEHEAREQQSADKERETRHHDCPFCGKQWREYCEDDFPDYCPKCGDKLEAWGAMA